jgi:competence ComEA-like helix-hairpin-helix protein
MFTNNSSILQYYAKNSLTDKAKFDTKFTAPLSATDGVGFVYGFYPRKQINNKGTWIKLGRTAKWNPNERVNEWDGEIAFCVKTFANKKLERLVHLLFSYANIIIRNPKSNANEIEWFCFKEKTNITTLVSMLNDMLTDLHANSIDSFDAEPEDSLKVKSTVIESTIAKSFTNKINLNTATVEQLQTIYGIGPKLSQRIVDDRVKNGLYINVEQVQRVYMIGPKRYESISQICYV